MIHRSQVTALLWCCLAISACDQQSQELSPTHAAAIRDSVAAMLGALRRYAATRQWDSLAGLYADHPAFRWVENGSVRYRSPGDIRRALEGVPFRFRIETTHRDTEINPLAPGIASVVTAFETRFVDTAGTGFGFAGVITMILGHRPEGWRILSGHTSSPIPQTR